MSRFCGGFLGLGAWLIPLVSVTRAEDAAPPLPPSVAQALRWLPEDTETLVVARPFPVERLLHPNDAGPLPSWRDVAAGLGVTGLDMAPDGPLLGQLRGRRVESLITGMRNFDEVSSFGFLRSENCTIVRFLDDGAAADREWAATNRPRVQAIRTIAGREVFVFPSHFTKEPWTRPREWQGMFVVILDARTTLYATSDRYLETVLRQIDDPAPHRALPASLPEWRWVDPQATTWMLRHFPQPSARLHSTGLTVTWQDDGFRVVYLAEPAREIDLALIQRSWFPENLPDRHARFARPDEARDGRIALDFRSTFNPVDDLWLGWMMFFIIGAGRD